MSGFKRWSWVQLLIGLLVGGVGLSLALRQVAWEQVAIAFQHLHWGWYALALGWVLLVSAGKALRWMLLYPATAEPLPWHDHFAMLLIAQMLNILIPVRLGEIARLGLMQQARRPLGMTLGTLAAEKAFDLLTTGAFLALALPFVVWSEARVTAFSVMGSGLLVLLGLLALGLTRAFWLRWLERLPRPRRPWLAAGMERVLRLPRALLAWAGALSPWRWLLASFLSLLVWSFSVLCMEAVLRAFGWHLPYAALLLMLAITFTNLLPQPPALVGTVLFVTQEMLLPFGLTRAQTLAVGAALNIAMVLPIVLGGAWATSVRLTRLLGTPSAGRLRRALGLDVLLGGREVRR